MKAKVSDPLGTLHLFIPAMLFKVFFIEGLDFSRSVLDMNLTLKYWIKSGHTRSGVMHVQR